jgi:membrane associated rhomboid family serine protease
MEEDFGLENEYEDKEYSSSLFVRDNVNPLYRHIHVQPPPKAAENYLLYEWKYFTIGSSFSIIASYLIGIVEMDKYDRDARSYNSEYLLLRMITLWPDCVDKRYEIWRLWSCVFSHADLSHFSSNIIGLVLFSFLLESYQPWTRILPLFLLGTAHGNLAFYYAKPYYGAIGVSQGVFALIGLNCANIMINWNAFPRLDLLVLSYFCVTMILGEVISYDEESNIAYICHWGSLASGILGGIGFLKQYKPTRCGSRTSYVFMFLYCCYGFYLMYHYTFEWPPLQSYTNTLQPIDTNDCCHEWLLYQSKFPNASFSNFTCPVNSFTSLLPSYYKAEMPLFSMRVIFENFSFYFLLFLSMRVIFA